MMARAIPLNTDVTQNRGALVVGVSHDTPTFAAHVIAHWWRQEGSTRYFGSRQLVILADTGGRSSAAVMPGKPSSGLNWPTPLPWP
jgi:hypothetical protein